MPIGPSSCSRMGCWSEEPEPQSPHQPLSALRATVWWTFVTCAQRAARRQNAPLKKKHRKGARRWDRRNASAPLTPAYLCNHTPEETRSSAHPALVKLVQKVVFSIRPTHPNRIGGQQKPAEPGGESGAGHRAGGLGAGRDAQRGLGSAVPRASATSRANLKTHMFLRYQLSLGNLPSRSPPNSPQFAGASAVQIPGRAVSAAGPGRDSVDFDFQSLDSPNPFLAPLGCIRSWRRKTAGIKST
jgi:hypothetical protein